MATAYHRDQPGAPALPYSLSQSAANQFGSLKLILKACLINGYAGCPAAGWTFISEGDEYIVLKPGTDAGYVCLTWTSGFVAIYLAATFDGMSGKVMLGAGLKTGTSANNALPQQIKCSQIAASPDSTSWCMVADNKSFALQLYTRGSFTSPGDPASDFSGTIYVGEDSEGNFISVGGHNTAGSVNTPSFNPAAAFTALTNPATGLLIGSGSISVVSPALSTAATYTGALAVLEEVFLAPPAWFVPATNTLGGKLRGVALDPNFSICSAVVASAMMGVPTAPNTRTASVPISLGDGFMYFISTDSRSPTRLLTDNPAFWS